MTLRHTSTALLATMLILLTGACVNSDDIADSQTDSGVSLALSVSPTRGNVTRMSDEVTQQEGKDFRPVQDIFALPFKSEINNDNLTLESNAATSPTRYDNEHYNYIDDRSVKIPDGTSHFLCYCRAVPETGKFVNGALTHNLKDATTTTTGKIKFCPEVIHNSTAANTDAYAIANYLTAIANEIATSSAASRNDFFRQFTNEGHPVAASSLYAKGMKEWANVWATSENITLTKTTSDPVTGYPASISLPDGAAVVCWNSTNKEFFPVIETTTEANINSLNRFVYPAELWYYANSPIRTSEESQKEKYGQWWSEVLKAYDDGDGIMSSSIHSVAVRDPLTYAVGCLQICLKPSTPLADAGTKSIPLNATDGDRKETFPLTGIFVAGQYAQGYDFTPKNDVNELVIYDQEINGISMGIPETDEGAPIYNNTLVLQSQDGKSVRFALEFENNSGEDFEGVNGTVFAGTKFYLVGTIDLDDVQADADTPADVKGRVFTKDYITQGTVKITSLKDAHTYLPDLLDPRLEIGIKLQTNWIQATTTSVPL